MKISKIVKTAVFASTLFAITMAKGRFEDRPNLECGTYYIKGKFSYSSGKFIVQMNPGSSAQYELIVENPDWERAMAWQGLTLPLAIEVTKPVKSNNSPNVEFRGWIGLKMDLNNPIIKVEEKACVKKTTK